MVCAKMLLIAIALINVDLPDAFEPVITQSLLITPLLEIAFCNKG